MLKFLLFISLLLPLLTFGQSAREDSLRNELTNGDLRSKISAHVGLSQMYMAKNIEESKRFAEKAYALAVELDEEKELAIAGFQLGFVNEKFGYFDVALAQYVYAMQYFKNAQDSLNTAEGFLRLGNTYLSLDKIETAKRYLTQAADYYKAMGNDLKLADTYNFFGSMHKDLGDLDSALFYHSKALEHFVKKQDTISMAYAYNNIGLVFKKKGSYIKALEYLKSSLELKRKLNDVKGMASSLINIANISSITLQREQALAYYTEGIEKAQQVHANNYLLNAYYGIAELHAFSNRPMESYKFFDLYISLKDSMYDLAFINKTREMEVQYETESKEREIEILNKERELDAAKLSESNAEVLRQEAESAKEKQYRNFLLLGITLVVLLVILIYSRYRLQQKANDTLETQNAEIDKRDKEKAILLQEMHDSINYAKRIQNAILPPNKLIKSYLPNSFVIYKPKDIVAGDFYWMEPKDDRLLFAVADCTGHGVPGAMVSVICNNALNRSVRDHGLTNPGQILDKTRKIVVAEFEKSEEDVKDGMDIALCSLRENVLEYAGAHNPLWILRNGSSEIEEIKANKQPIGKFSEPKPYTSHTLQLESGDSFFLFSDGYADQFGGTLHGVKGKKFKTANFKKLLVSIKHQTMEQQCESIISSFEEWMGDLEQLDDVCVIGVRI